MQPISFLITYQKLTAELEGVEADEGGAIGLCMGMGTLAFPICKYESIKL